MECQRPGSMVRRRRLGAACPIVGIVGACIAGLVLTPLFGISTINQSDFSLPALLVSLVGAVILLAIGRVIRRTGRRYQSST